MKYESHFSFIRVMNPTIKTLLLVSIVLKESITITASDSLPQYDITAQLNEAIIKVFQSVNPNAAMKLISHIENRGNSKYETKNAQRLPPFGNKIYFHDVNVSIWEPFKTPKIYCEFHKNKTRIYNDELVFKVVGLVDTMPRKAYASFKTHMKFKDISISAVESSKGPYNNQFQINISYNRLMFNYMSLPWTQESNIPNKKQEKLMKRIKSIVPTMVYDNINHNEKFIHKLHSSFCHNPKQKIISSYPNFPSHEDQFYYLIPKINLQGVDLVNVKIKGLSNFESLRPNVTFGNSAYTLILKKVQGSMNLDGKEVDDLSSYEMKFIIDYIFITVDYETKRLVVEARDYKVIHVNTNPPKESIFAMAIIQNLETAITASIQDSLECEFKNDSRNHLSTFATAIMPNVELAIASSIMESLEISVSDEIAQPSTAHDTVDIAPKIITESAQPSTTQDTDIASKIIAESSTVLGSIDFVTKTSSRTKNLKLASKTARYAKFTGAMHKFAFQKLLESSTSSPSTAHTTENSNTQKLNVKTRRNPYARFSDAMYKLKKSFPSSSPSSSTKQITKIATSTQITTKTPPSRADSVTQSTQTFTSSQVVAETSQKSNLSVKTTTINDEKEPFDYDISFHNVTIRLISGSSYPKQIQCEFFKNLKIDHQINAIPTGNIRLNNKGNAISINFHANFTAIEIAVVKPGDNFNENETCEFQIHNNRDIKVILPSMKNKTLGNENLKIKTKIDQTLMSMMKERITRTVKPLVCLPFDYCSQSVQVLDDFFQSVVDKVLKKCSLRRTTTS